MALTASPRSSDICKPKIFNKEDDDKISLLGVKLFPISAALTLVAPI